MKKESKASTTVESELNIKAVAALRNEIINELTKPDRPIGLLLEDKDETKDNERDGI